MDVSDRQKTDADVREKRSYRMQLKINALSLGIQATTHLGRRIGNRGRRYLGHSMNSGIARPCGLCFLFYGTWQCKYELESLHRISVNK